MQRYRIPKTRVVYEVLNTEVIAIDFNTGNYYALIHVAKQIWQMLERQLPVEQIVSILSNRYKREPDLILADLQPLLSQLMENGLIEPSDETALAQCDVDELLKGSEDWAYDPPVVQKYMDVQDLLLLDPIHEVTETGWPNKQ